MNIIEVVLIGVSALFYLITIIFSVLSKKPLKTLIFNAFLGIIALAILDLTSKFTNTYVPINVYTVSYCGMFGVPALICFLVLQILFV